MRLTNKTKYSTPDLRRFLLAGLRFKGASTDKHVRVIYSKRSTHYGEASYPCGGTEARHIMLTVPGDPAKFDLRKFGQVIEHEIDHTLGLHHREMAHWWTLPVPWIAGLTIGLKPARPRVDAAEKREQHARAMAERWERKLETAERQLQKWTQKVRYYDRKQAARPARKA